MKFVSKKIERFIEERPQKTVEKLRKLKELMAVVREASTIEDVVLSDLFLVFQLKDSMEFRRTPLTERTALADLDQDSVDLNFLVNIREIIDKQLKTLFNNIIARDSNLNDRHDIQESMKQLQILLKDFRLKDDDNLSRILTVLDPQTIQNYVFLIEKLGEEKCEDVLAHYIYLLKTKLNVVARAHKFSSRYQFVGNNFHQLMEGRLSDFMLQLREFASFNFDNSIFRDFDIFSVQIFFIVLSLMQLIVLDVSKVKKIKLLNLFFVEFTKKIDSKFDDIIHLIKMNADENSKLPNGQKVMRRYAATIIKNLESSRESMRNAMNFSYESFINVITTETTNLSEIFLIIGTLVNISQQNYAFILFALTFYKLLGKCLLHY